MFISIFKSEAHHKLQPESFGKEPLFTFDYGQSFILYVIGFVVVELAGILNVCLFNKLQKIAQDNQVSRKKRLRFCFAAFLNQSLSIEVAGNLIFRPFPFPVPTSCLVLLSLDISTFLTESFPSEQIRESWTDGFGAFGCQHMSTSGRGKRVRRHQNIFSRNLTALQTKTALYMNIHN
jgi:hypothetical protein